MSSRSVKYVVDVEKTLGACRRGSMRNCCLAGKNICSGNHERFILHCCIARGKSTIATVGTGGGNKSCCKQLMIEQVKFTSERHF